MKKIIMTALIIGLVTSCKDQNNTENSNKEIMETIEKVQVSNEETLVKKVIQTVFEGADKRDWKAIASVMHDSVYTDYTALGGDSGFKTPDQILQGWKALLPGFDATVHQVHNEAIWVAGDRATATFDAIAVHYLDQTEGEKYWTVFVGYDTEFIKTGSGWKLARIDVSLYDQFGNTNLPAKAIEVVNSNNLAQLSSDEKPKAAAETFFQALETSDLEKLLSTMDKDAVQQMPMAPSNFPTVLDGKRAIENQYKGVMSYTQRYERTYAATSNPNVVLAKFNGIVTTNEGKPYHNSYVNIFEVNDKGEIIKIVEHFDPYILLNSWPGLQPETFSVHKAGAKTSEGVTLKTVSFNSEGNILKGHLFLPPNFDATKKYPVAIVTGSWTSVKEQMPDEYASLIAQNGTMALTFDFTGFGESEGQPRQLEDHRLKVVDIKAAVDFLVGHTNVDANAISGLGVCASSGYMAHATANDARISKLILVAPWLHNQEIAKAIYDTRPGGTEGLIEASRMAQKEYSETGNMPYSLAASELDPLSAMYVPENIFDYYLDPAKAAGKYYDNRFAVASWEPWLTFDGISIAKDIKQPVYMVHSESGAVPQGAKAFYELLQGEKDITWLNDYNQQQLYFEKDAVDAATAQVVKYLNN